MNHKYKTIPKSIHKESLCQIPLVRQFLTDKNIKLRARRVDNNWNYHKTLPITVTGFTPWNSEIYYAQNSSVANWLKNPFSSSRKYNEGDFLVPELMMLIHDYLHAWAYLAIHNLAPKIGLAQKSITKDNIEDFVFCHLVTEAMATVGLDFWYLSNINFNSVCNVGTGFTGLTSSYRESSIQEYQRLNKKFEVQSTLFFEQMAEFYCTGEWLGFDVQDIKKSPLLLNWIQHELSYGEIQRRYAREWFAYLSQDQIKFNNLSRNQKVSCLEPWKKKLIKKLGILLWDKIKNDKLNHFNKPFQKEKLWSIPANKPLNFRFCNLNAINPKTKIDFADEDAQNFYYYFYQFLARIDYKKCNKSLIKLSKTLLDSKDLALLHHVYRNEILISKTAYEPKTIFILN